MARARRRRGRPCMVVSSNAGSTVRGGRRRPGCTWWLQAYVTADRAACLPLLRACRGRRGRGGGADRGHPGGRHQVRRRRARRSGTWPTRPGCGSTSQPGTASQPGRREGHRPRPPGRRVAARGHRAAGGGQGRAAADDARRCVEAGAAAVWVSNHGGRQLDRAAATARCLAAVVAEVGRRRGGVRRRGSALRPARAGRAGAGRARRSSSAGQPLYALAAPAARRRDAGCSRSSHGELGRGAAAGRLRLGASASRGRLVSARTGALRRTR